MRPSAPRCSAGRLARDCTIHSARRTRTRLPGGGGHRRMLRHSPPGHGVAVQESNCRLSSKSSRVGPSCQPPHSAALCIQMPATASCSPVARGCGCRPPLCTATQPASALRPSDCKVRRHLSAAEPRCRPRTSHAPDNDTYRHGLEDDASRGWSLDLDVQLSSCFVKRPVPAHDTGQSSR